MQVQSLLHPRSCNPGSPKPARPLALHCSMVFLRLPGTGEPRRCSLIDSLRGQPSLWVSPPTPPQGAPYRDGNHSAVCKGRHHHLLEDVFLPGGSSSCWLTCPVGADGPGFGDVGPRFVAQHPRDPHPPALILTRPSRFPGFRSWTQPVGWLAVCMCAS